MGASVCLLSPFIMSPCTFVSYQYDNIAFKIQFQCPNNIPEVLKSVKCRVEILIYFRLDHHRLQSSQFNPSQAATIRYAPSHLRFALPLPTTVQPNAAARAPPADSSHTAANSPPAARGDHAGLDVHLQPGSCQLKAELKHLAVAGALVYSVKHR